MFGVLFFFRYFVIICGFVQCAEVAVLYACSAACGDAWLGHVCIIISVMPTVFRLRVLVYTIMHDVVVYMLHALSIVRKIKRI